MSKTPYFTLYEYTCILNLSCRDARALLSPSPSWTSGSTRKGTGQQLHFLCLTSPPCSQGGTSRRWESCPRTILSFPPSWTSGSTRKGTGQYFHFPLCLTSLPCSPGGTSKRWECYPWTLLSFLPSWIFGSTRMGTGQQLHFPLCLTCPSCFPGTGEVTGRVCNKFVIYLYQRCILVYLIDF